MPIGSGVVEGAAKTIIGRRPRLNSSRWIAQRAEHMPNLRRLLYGEPREAFWNEHAA